VVKVAKMANGMVYAILTFTQNGDMNAITTVHGSIENVWLPVMSCCRGIMKLRMSGPGVGELPLRIASRSRGI
jgi:hypothetical protein